MDRSRWLPLVGILGLILVAGLSAQEKKDQTKTAAKKTETTKNEKVDPAKSDQPGKAANTITLKPTKFRAAVRLKGTVEAREYREISIEPKRWTQFKVLTAIEHGTLVKAGQTLVTFDPEKIDLAIREAEMDRKLAEISLKLLKQELAVHEKTKGLDLAFAEKNRDNAKQDLDKFLTSDKAMITESFEFSVKNTRNFLENQLEELKQLEKMYKLNDLTEETEEIIIKRQKNQVESAQFQVKMSENRRDAQLKIELPRRERELRDAAERSEISFERTRFSLPLTSEQKKLAYEKAVYEDGKAAERLEETLADRKLFTVKAPVDGLLYYGKCETGQWTMLSMIAPKLRKDGSIQPEETFMTIVDPQKLRVRSSVDEANRLKLKPGQKVKLTAGLDAATTFEGTIASLSIVPHGAGNFEVMIDVATMPAGVVPGVSITGQVVIASQDNALVVPAEAVFTDEDKDEKYLMVVPKDAQPTRRIVKVGETSGGKTEVLSGVTAGEVISTKKPEEAGQ